MSFRWIFLLKGLLALILIALLGQTWVTAQSVINPDEVHIARATYYNLEGSPNCGLGTHTSNDLISAISYLDYGLADWCGAYVEVTGPKGKVTVQIIDKCPDSGCMKGHLDLSPVAFAQIADLQTGIINITWKLVSPATMPAPISFHFKDGSSQWWTGVQVRDHRNPIVKFEYSNKGAPFKAVSRTDYNYFVELSGMGTGPFSFRITDVYGNVVTVDNITAPMNGDMPSNGYLVTTTAQFPQAGVTTTATPTATSTKTPTATTSPTPNKTVTATPSWRAYLPLIRR